MEVFNNVNNTINSIIWGPVTLAVLMLVGLTFSIITRFFQFRGVKLWGKKTVGSLFKKEEHKGKKGITAFEAMSAALSGCMGTGNIVGVATAITIGGAGAIFWMWVSALLGMATSFAENTLAVKFHHVDENGEISGGPMYYIEKGLRCKPLAIIFSICCIGASFGIGNMSQSNSIATAVHDTFGADCLVTSIVIAVLVGVIIIGGIKRLVAVTSKLVPFMVIIYVVCGLAVVVYNGQNLGNVFGDIFTQAFGISQVAGGVSGAMLLNALRTGMSRGTFSNEAGMGSSAIAHGASGTKEPIEQGMWGVFQVFTDTIIGCTITALVILSSGALSSGKDGVELTSLAFSSVFGNFGQIVVLIGITLFAFSTLITWEYYGERGLLYITKGKGAIVYKLAFCLIIVVGGISELSTVWTISDSLNGLMIIPNIIALILLLPVVKKEYQKYFDKRKKKALK